MIGKVGQVGHGLPEKRSSSRVEMEAPLQVKNALPDMKACTQFLRGQKASSNNRRLPEARPRNKSFFRASRREQQDIDIRPSPICSRTRRQTSGPSTPGHHPIQNREGWSVVTFKNSQSFEVVGRHFTTW